MSRAARFIGASLCVVGWLAMAPARAATEKSPEHPAVAGRVVEVTFYRGQALVTRTIPVEEAKGGATLIVGPLPEQVVPQSLFAEGGEGVEIRAVRFRSRAVGDEPREEVRKLDQAVEELGEQLEAINREQQVVGRQTAYLDQMDNFVLPTMKTDLARGFLDAVALEKLTQLSFSRREALAKKIGELQKASKNLNKQLGLLQHQRAELTAGAQKSVREALLFVEKRSDVKESVRLSYLVNNCYWSPSYTIRAGKDRKNVAVECNAVISQMTGEDWSDVQLTLSTASPALSASGPGLAPLPITLTQAGRGVNADAGEIAARARGIQGQKAEVVKKNLSVFGFDESIGLSWQLNTAAGEYQTLELAVGKDLLSSAVAACDTEGPSLSYRLTHPVSLSSRRDQQMVRIMQTNFASAFYHVATPVLSSYVYREAELRNQGDDDLLAGPITVYLDGRFVGRSEIPTVARGQTFVVGFGADPQLRARRELVDRSEVVQGGNRELSFKYRLVIENFKQETAAVRLFDRAPYSDRPTEVRIKLGEMKDPLSTDPLYVRTERPKNILRWDLTVPASATAEKARLLEYGFTVEFDRNLTVGLPQAVDLEEEPKETSAPADRRRGSGSPGLGGGMGGMAAPAAAGSPAIGVINQPQQAPQPARKPSDVHFRQFEQMQRAKAAH